MIVGAREIQPNILGATVFGDIRQRFLRDAIECRLNVGLQASIHFVYARMKLDATRLETLARIPA